MQMRRDGTHFFFDSAPEFIGVFDVMVDDDEHVD
jgi:hypothetical protein